MFTRTIRSQMLLGKSGVRWELAVASTADVSATLLRDDIKKAKNNENPAEALKTLLDTLKNVPSNETQDAKNIREGKISEVQKALNEVLAESKKKEAKLNADALENTDFSRKFGNRINLGAVIPFINKQYGNTLADKIQSAFNKAKSNTTRSDAGTTVNIDAEYQMKSKLSEKAGNYLSEYNALTALLESMMKNQKVYDDLKAQNIPPDRKVDSNSLIDLFTDFDDDGVIEAVNGVNDAGLWNKFKWIFTDLDGAQKDYLGEHQVRNKITDPSQLTMMLSKLGITQNSNEEPKAFAKRARAALLMSASISGTAEINPENALSKMQKNEKYKEERGNIEKQIADLQKSISEKNSNIKVEDANKLARSLASIVTTYVTSMGLGSANADKIMQQLGQSITTPKGNMLFLGVDLGMMAKVVNTERFKASLGAGLGGGVSSDGLFAFAHVDAEGKFTVIDKSTLEDIRKNSWNTTLTAGVHAGMDLQNFKLVPAYSIDALWNDRIDSLDNALLKMNAILDKLTVVGKDGKISLNLSGLPKNLDPILQAQLNSLKYLVENWDSKMTKEQQNAHAILMRDRFMQSFKVFMASQPEFKWFSLAGIKFAVVPGAFLLGPVFQDISVDRTAKVVPWEKRKAESGEQADYMKEFGLSWDSKTGILTRNKSNTTKVILADGLAWDEKDAKVVFPGGKMPKFTIDTWVSTTLGGRGERVIIVSMAESTTSKESGKIDVIVEKLASKESLPKGTLEMIQALPINKLIERRDVQKFMKAMTQENGFSEAIGIVKGMSGHKGIPEFKRILWAESDVGKAKAILTEIDEKLVGDLVTRNFNAAKTNIKAFAEYKKLLLARWAKLPKGFSQGTMKIGDIAWVSFDKKWLRNQEINIIADTTWIDATTLSSADKEMIQAISGDKKLETQGSGYMSMARNRRTVQWSRGYETGSYIQKRELWLTTEQSINAIQKGMKNDLVKVALANLAGRSEFALYKDAINDVDSKKVNLVAWKATVNIGDNRTLTIDLSGSKVFSALYGDTKMNSGTKEQAVCVNVAVLYEPSVAGVITDNGKATQAPEMEIIGSDTVMIPSVSTNTVSILGAAPRWHGSDDENGPHSNTEGQDKVPGTPAPKPAPATTDN